MRYCSSCKKIYADSQSGCSGCKKKTKEITDINEPVALAVAGGTERALLIALLKDNDIPYIEQHVTPQGVSNDLVTGYDVKLSNIIILVPYSALPKAYDLSKSIEDLNNDYIEELLPQINEDIEKAKNKPEEKEMSPALRTTIKIITAIIFLILIALVVFGTDYITGLIKGLLGG